MPFNIFFFNQRTPSCSHQSCWKILNSDLARQNPGYMLQNLYVNCKFSAFSTMCTSSPSTSQLHPRIHEQFVLMGLFNSETYICHKDINNESSTSSPWTTMAQYATHGHICKLCISYKNFTIIQALRYTTHCYFSTCVSHTSPLPYKVGE